MNLNKSKWEFLISVYRLCKPFHIAFMAGLGITLAFQLLSLAAPFLLGKLVDGFQSDAPKERLITLATYILGLELFELVLIPFGHYINAHKMEADLQRYLNRYTFEKIMGLSLGQVTSEHSGFRQSAIDEGMSAIVNVVNLMVTQVLPMFIKVVAVMTAMLFFNWQVGVIATITVLAFMTTSIIINMKLLPGLRILKQKSRHIKERHTDIMRNLGLVIINSKEEVVTNRFDNEFEGYSGYQKKFWDGYVWRVLLLRDPIVRIGLFAVIVTGIFLLKEGKLSAGQVVTSISWSMILFGNIGNMGSMQRQLMRLSNHISQFFEIVNTPSDIVVIDSPKRIPNLGGRIQFCNVSFHYPTADGVNGALDNVSFTIEAGQTCAFVGHSGSGKTTLVKLIQRASDPNVGQILVDGIPLKHLDPKWWRQSIGYVPQEVELFDDTLGHNMTFGCDEWTCRFTDVQLDALARQTRIDQFYPRLGEERFKVRIGERGLKLSGGERQRVGIARALAKNPRILIFDEATNSLDTVNERTIQDVIAETLKGRTGIIIAHRLSTVRHADKIIVLHQGRKVGEGRHDELLVNCPEYRALVESDMMHSL